MFATAGARENHNQLVWNLIAQFRRPLASERGDSSEMRVRVSRKGLYTYPDVVVV